MSLMAFSVTSKHCFLAIVLVYVFVSSWESGKAYDDRPHLGAADVIAKDYVPAAEDEGKGEGGEEGEGEGEEGEGEGKGEGEGEGEGEEGEGKGKGKGEEEGEGYFPEGGVTNTNPDKIFEKALECFHDKHIYSSCDEAYRLSQSGEINVPPEYTEQYCKGPCLAETHHVLDCIDSIAKHFKFYNKATLKEIKETIKEGCSYGPKRGDFNVAEHLEAEEDSARTAAKPAVYGLLLMYMAWRALF